MQTLRTDPGPATRRGAGPSEERLARVTAMFVGLGGLFYGVVCAPLVVSQIDISTLPWTVAAATLVFGSAAVMAIAGRWLSYWSVRRAILAFAVIYLVGEVTWFIVHNDGSLERGMAIWIAYFPGLVAVALAAIADWRVCLSAGCVVVPLGIVMTRSLGGNQPIPFAVEAFMNTMFTLVFALAINAFVRTGRTLDQTSDQARRQAGINAGMQARESERRRFDALVHDGVLATLLAASNERDQISEATARQARETLSELQRIRKSPDADAEVKLDAVVTRVRATVELHHDSAIFAAEIEPMAIDSIPEDAVESLIAGVTEAVRNVIRHAEAQHCRVVLHANESGLTITVTDDGRGFDPARVPPTRLGLAVSIRARQKDLAGGWADVESAPGHGTSVTLGWGR